MTQVINLKQKRKQKARKAKRHIADQNAALHGRSKAEKALQQAQTSQAARVLDGHKRDV